MYRRSHVTVVVVTLIWVGVSPGGGLTGVMMGLAILCWGLILGLVVGRCLL